MAGIFSRVHASLNKGQRVIVLTHLQDEGNKWMWEGEASDDFPWQHIEELQSAMDHMWTSAQAAHIQVVQTSQGDFLLELFAPSKRLVVAGCGHIGQALARIADVVGFAVTVVDDRPAFANKARFPVNTEVLMGPFTETLQKVTMDVDTAVVVVTRGHLHDTESLRAVLGRGAGYVGLIGSRRRVTAVLQGLKNAGFDHADLEPVYAPIGLDIGAETPQEIALSIVAEIVRVHRGGTGASLSLTERLLRSSQLRDKLPANLAKEAER